MRAGICALLATQEDIEVVGEASNGQEAIEKTLQLMPHIVLMDIAMPGINGLEATRHIHKVSPDTKVIILTRLDDKEYMVSGIDSGAIGCITKTALPAELISAIHAAHEGEFFLCPTAASALVKELQDKKERGDKDLTPRQKEILHLLAAGLSSREISERLFVSVKTVLKLRANIMEKLKIDNSADLINTPYARN